MPQSQRSLRESQGALLEKVEQLAEQLKQERQRALDLEGQLTSTALSRQTLDKVPRLNRENVDADLLQDERDFLKDSVFSPSAPREDI